MDPEHWLKDLVPEDISDVIRLYLTIAACLVSVKAGIELVQIVTATTTTPTVLKALNKITELIGIDSLIRIFYGWLLDDDFGLKKIYYDLGFFVFAPIGPTAGAMWYEEKLRSAGSESNKYIQFAIKLLFMVLWCVLFGWAILILVLFWPIPSYFFIFKYQGTTSGDLLMRRETTKNTAIVMSSLIVGVLISSA